MRAVVCERFGPPSELREVNIARPEPGPDDVLVQVAATGIGFVDGLLVQGKYQVKPPLPFYPGNEFAGSVAAVGAQVDHFAVGDRVFGSAGGALADYVCTRAANCFATPAELKDTQAASLFINYLTAVYGLERCNSVRAGETMLVLGAAGGVGSAAIAVAKALGLRVIGAASSEDKRALARAAGADEVVDYTQADWRDALRALAPAGLDLVYDPVGGDATETAFRSLAPGGRLLVVGFASGAIPRLPLNLALLKRASAVGVDWGGDARANPELNAGLVERLQGLIGSGALRLAPVAERPASDFVAALEDQLAGRIRGKLVLSRS
ncbi:MAG: NADPH:quinone oxidoreductase family protein [Pseudomonadota bacterium]